MKSALAAILLVACSTPRMLEVGPNGGECKDGNGLSTLCADGVTCCRTGTECSYTPGQCIVVDERPAPFAGVAKDGGH